MDELDGWLRHLETLHPKTMDLGLERVSQVFAVLDIPQTPQRTFVIAGTNGKGSTVGYVSSLLRAMGHEVVSYISPHIFAFNERIAINGAPADDATIVAALQQVEAARGDISLSYFEFATLAALCIAKQHEHAFRVFEIGLGGRLDAVNLLDSGCPIITSIGLDHTEYLGNSRDEIAFEKAGVLRAGYPAVCGDAEPPATLRELAREREVPMSFVDEDFGVTRDPEGVSFWNSEGAFDLTSDWVLPGAHQARNAACAVQAVLQSCSHAQVTEAFATKVVCAPAIAGRMQQVASRPNIFVDVGHNPAAAQAVVAMLSEQVDGGETYVLLAMLQDKDAGSVANILNDVADHMLLAGLSGPRGQTAAALASKVVVGISELDPAKIENYDDIPAALNRVLGKLEDQDRLVIFGSFAAAEQALRYFDANHQ